MVVGISRLILSNEDIACLNSRFRYACRPLLYLACFQPIIVIKLS